jgi:membrane-associated phospholipid phosphatase
MQNRSQRVGRRATAARGSAGIPLVLRFALVLLLASTSGVRAADDGFVGTLASEIRRDFREHYSRRPLINVAIGFGVSGVLANSDFDQEIQDVFRDDLQGALGDDLTDLFTAVGDVAQPLTAVPIYLGAMWLGNYGDDTESAAARWGDRSLRAMLIGTPQLVALSQLSGGQRPEDGEPGWDPFAADDGVSGHAFFGAVPLLTAAAMTEKRWLRRTLYALSAMPGLARVYDEKHYMSQVFMGWWLARAATRSVLRTDRESAGAARLTAVPYADGGGLQLDVSF